MKWVEIERFSVRADDGYETKIVIDEQLLDVATRNNPAAVGRGGKRARTTEGYAAQPDSDSPGIWIITTDPLHPNRRVRRVD